MFCPCNDEFLHAYKALYFIEENSIFQTPKVLSVIQITSKCCYVLLRLSLTYCYCCKVHSCSLTKFDSALNPAHWCYFEHSNQKKLSRTVERPSPHKIAFHYFTVLDKYCFIWERKVVRNRMEFGEGTLEWTSVLPLCLQAHNKIF